MPAMPKVFISYAREDMNRALGLEQALREAKAGFKP